jgi:hypothetical protein
MATGNAVSAGADHFDAMVLTSLEETFSNAPDKKRPHPPRMAQPKG